MLSATSIHARALKDFAFYWRNFWRSAFDRKQIFNDLTSKMTKNRFCCSKYWRIWTKSVPKEVPFYKLFETTLSWQGIIQIGKNQLALLKSSKVPCMRSYWKLYFQQLADAGRKQLEQLLHQLQEQLQINLLQQTHLMQSNSNIENKSGVNSAAGGNKTNSAMQQLQIQQQQLISQLQLVQQRLLVVSRVSHVLEIPPSSYLFSVKVIVC